MWAGGVAVSLKSVIKAHDVLLHIACGRYGDVQEKRDKAGQQTLRDQGILHYSVCSL